jgi:hypothetical protein
MAKQNATVRATGKVLLRFGVQRKAAYRCLAALESAGLVAVDRRPGRCPEVTILACHEAEETERRTNEPNSSIC